MSIAFLGPAGTFTESALRQIEPDPAHHLPVASVPAALAAVRDGRARLVLRRETLDDLTSLEVGQ